MSQLRKIVSSKATYPQTAIYLVAVISASTHVVITFGAGGPVAVPDVPAYLSVAQWVFGGKLSENLAFHPGYGILLSPFGWLPGHILHQVALGFNSLLVGVAVVQSAALAQRLGASASTKLLIACIAAIHPSLSSGSRIGWPENLLIVMMLAITLLMLADISSRWNMIGFLGTATFLIHPRAIVVLIGCVISGILSKQTKRLLVGMLPTLIFVVIALQSTGTWPIQRIVAVKSVNDGPNPFSVAFGQLLAVGAGTAGLALIGFLAGIMTLRHVKRMGQREVATFFLSVSLAGMLILGGLVLAGSNSSDTLLYGRYVDIWSLPLLIVGLQTPFKMVSCRWPLRLLMLYGVITFLVLWGASSSTVFAGRRIMTLSLGGLWDIFNGEFVGVALAALVVTIFPLLCFIISPSRGKKVAVLLVFALGISATISNHQHLAEVGRISAGQTKTAALVGGQETCLTHDSSSTKPYAVWLYRLQLPELHHTRLDASQVAQWCGLYIIASDSVAVNCAGIQLVAMEERADWGLWLHPEQGCGG